MQRFLIIGVLTLGLVFTIVGSPAQALTTTASTAPTQTAGQEDRTLPPTLKDCLVKNLGDNFEDVKEGNVTDDPTLLAASETCFDAETQSGRSLFHFIAPPKDQGFAPQTASCLGEKLGKDFEKVLQEATGAQAKKLQNEINDCFGKGPKDGQLPPEVRSCIVGILGESGAKSLFDSKQPPDPKSETATKLREAGCFKDFDHGPENGPRPTAEQEECIKGILGGKLPGQDGTEPAEKDKILIGRTCFKVGLEGPKEGPGPMPEAVRACLSAALGDSYKEFAKDPNYLTKDQGAAVGECFNKNKFNPGNPNGPNGPDPNGPAPDPKTEACIKQVTGSERPDDLSAALRQEVGEKCFKNGPGTNGSNGPGQPGSVNGGPAGPRNFDPTTQACIDKITGGKNPRDLSDFERKQIGETCIKSGLNGSNPGPNEQRGPNGGPDELRGPNGGPSNLDPAKQACIDRVAGGKDPRSLTPEQNRQIGKECLGEQNGPSGSNGNPGQPPQNFQGEQNQGPRNQPIEKQPQGQPNTFQPPAGQNRLNNPPPSNNTEDDTAQPANNATDDNRASGSGSSGSDSDDLIQ